MLINYNKNIISCLRLTVAVSAMAYALPVVAQVKGSTPAVFGEIMLDEIIVTATRRKSNLSDTPLSISALSPETLTSRGLRGIDDLVKAVPGITTTNDGDGTDRLFLRGIAAFGSVTTVSYYLDEAPLVQLATNSFSPRFFDLERVEVLRGPQGTLFGAGSMGGSIRIITAKPNVNEYEVNLRAEASATRFAKQNFTVDAAASVPIVKEKLALRLVGYYEKQAGWTKQFKPTLSDDPADYYETGTDPETGDVLINPETGEPLRIAVGLPQSLSPAAVGKRTGDQFIHGGRATLRFLLSDAVTLSANYNYQRRKNEGSTSEYVSTALGFNQGDFKQSSFFDSGTTITTQLGNFTAEADLGFGNFTSSTSYETNKILGTQDATSQFFPTVVAEFDAILADVAGNSGAISFSKRIMNSFTQEVRLVSSGTNRFNWILGGFYSKVRLNQTEATSVLGFARFASSPTDIGIESFFSRNIREMSVFGEVGYKITDKLTATFGMRRFDIKTRNNLLVSGPLIGLPTPPSQPGNENGLTYKGVLSYKPTKDTLLFASYTTGYRPGAPNFPSLDPNDTPYPASYNSDRLAQYELGIKTNWLDRRLSFNGSLFYIDWKDIPVVFLTESGSNYIINGPKARNIGAEIDVTARPIDGLSFSFNLGITDAKYAGDFTNPLSTVQIKKGDILPEVSRINLSTSIDYEWSIDNDIKASVGGNVAHIGRQAQVGESSTGPTGTRPSYNTIGLNAALGFGRIDISLFARNLFDERGLLSNAQLAAESINGAASGRRSINYIQPRTFGASIAYKF
jgi:iron complex outermembrane recepter protein